MRSKLLEPRILGAVLSASIGLATLARAGDPSPDGTGALLTSGGAYSLFHAVPNDKLRDFDTDRPDQATGPHTVDAGHVYVEMDLANYTLDRHNAERSPTDIDQWNVAPISVRVGLLPKVELDLIYDGYFNLRTRDRAAHQTQTESGVGDLTVRAKINVFGNDDGKCAFGIFPLIRFPTSSADLANHSIEGGMGLAFAAKLPGDFSLTASATFEVVRNSTDAYSVGDYSQALSVAHGLGVKNLSAFVEFANEISSESPSPAACQVDTGLIYQLSENTQIDLDCNFGVTRAAPDFVPFAGLAVRF